MPLDTFLDARGTVHRLMRLAFEDREDWLVEVLEYERESVSAQAAFARVIAEQKARPA